MRALLLSMIFCCTGLVQAKPVDPAWAALSGPLGEVFIHESGHAVTMLTFGIGIKSFRPFPNICGGKFVGGCVIPSKRFAKGAMPFLSERAQSAWISAAGSLFSMGGVLALAPLMPKIRNEFNRQTIENITYLQVRDFPFYIIADFLGFDGDWRSVSQLTGFGLWWFVPLAIGEYLVLDSYWDRYRVKALQKFHPEQVEAAMQKGPTFRLPLVKMSL